MFRDLYKKANEEIKGDRAILDRAFLQAAQPAKKKNPVIKYSFIGTAVAAVMVLGAVFANPNVFTDRTENLGKSEAVEPTEKEMVATIITNEADFAEEVIEDEAIEEKAIVVKENIVPKKAVTKNNAEGNGSNTAPVGVDSDDGVSSDDDDGEVAMGEEAPQNEYSVAMMSLDDEDEAVFETATEETVIGFTLRDRETVEETTAETIEAEMVEAFSYMYDLSVYEGITEGFVNTDVSPVENAEEAIDRAKKEINYENYKTLVYYDIVEGIWKITFSADEGSQMVYINNEGITQLIICE